MVAVMTREAVPVAIAALAAHGIDGALVGEVVAADVVGGARYVEGPLEGAP